MPRTPKTAPKEKPAAKENRRTANRDKRAATKTEAPKASRTTKSAPPTNGTKKTGSGSRRGRGNGTEGLNEATIRQRAFEIYEARGWSAPEHEVQDWLEAESQLVGKRRTR